MTYTTMPEDAFWKIIATINGPGVDAEAQMDNLRAALQGLSIEEIVAFEMTFRRLLNRAYTWDLWGAGLCYPWRVFR